jgi:hypothetical protein
VPVVGETGQATDSSQEPVAGTNPQPAILGHLAHRDRSHFHGIGDEADSLIEEQREIGACERALPERGDDSMATGGIVCTTFHAHGDGRP